VVCTDIVGCRVTSTSDDRTIYTFDATAGNKLKSFLWASLSTAEQALFASKGSTWSQYAGLATTQQALANDGSNLVGYLRGHSQYTTATDPVFRDRDHVLAIR